MEFLCRKMTGQFDYIVVGAGSAGCVLANRLSADGRSKVLLLEAGPKDNYLWIHIPIGYGKTMFHKAYNWGFYTDPEANMKDRRIYWPRGRGLGGSSSINGLIFIRGQREDYDHWAQLGNAGWDWNGVLPYFIKSEHNSRGASEAHGGDGPLWSSDITEKNELMEAILRGAGELGVPRTNDFNSGDQEGVGYFQLFTHKGWRISSAVAYLKPAKGRANLRIETDAQATGLIIQGRRAVGVKYIQNGVVLEAHAAREVILSAGALQSPQLLQLSGIGPSHLLQRHGIDVVHDLPGVGQNLQDHLQFRLMFRVSKPITTNDDLRSLAGQARIGLKWLMNGTGPLGIGINQGGLFTRILPGSQTPDIQFHFSTLSADMAGGKPHDWPGCTFSVCQLRPESRGTVEIRSADPLEPPSMRPNYLAAQIDRICAVESIKYARKLASTNALKSYIAGEYKPGALVQSDDEILDFARENGATIFHPSGTCKMGSDSMAVTDAKLRVHGIGGLRVVDCSIMPTLVSGNTHAPAVMIAEKAADMILTDSKESSIAA
jgi:choline dehydrogenase